MSLEDRLYALAEEARQQHGAAFLRSPELLIPPLTTQAPDLHAEIRVLAHLLRDDVVAKIAAAADPVAEENRLAAEIATRERLSIVAFAPAIAVARRLGQIPAAAAAAAAAPAAPAGGDWAGDSVVAGGPAPAGLGAFPPKAQVGGRRPRRSDPPDSRAPAAPAAAREGD